MKNKTTIILLIVIFIVLSLVQIYFALLDDFISYEITDYNNRNLKIKRLERPQQIYSNPVASENPNVYKNIVLTNDLTNKKVEYCFYVPESLKDKDGYPIIIIIPGIDGNSEYELHEGRQKFADENGFALAGITFKSNDKDFENYISYQYPYCWSAGAFLDVLENLKKDGVKYGNVYLHGYSAGAQFAGRTALLESDKIKGCVIISSGGLICPEKFIPVKFFFAVGQKDDYFHRLAQKVFIRAARKQKIYAKEKTYIGVDHDIPEKVFQDALNFIANVEKHN